MRWLLRFLVSDADRRAIESELAELYELRRRRDGDRAAARWLRGQRLAFPAHLVGERLRRVLADGLGGLPHVGRDATYTLRSLTRVPALTLTIVLTIGVGLGATAGMLGVVRTVLLSPLPYEAPDNLYWIYTDNPPFRFRFSVVDYRALEADHPALRAIAAYQTIRATVTEGTSPERANVKAVTGSYFPLLGQRAHLGRLFDASDDGRTTSAAVLTHAFWTRRFGGSPDVLGRTLTIDGVSHVVIGVLQREVGPLERDVAAFTVANWPPPTRKGPFFLMVLGRLQAAATPVDAAATLHATNARLFPIWRASYQDERATWGLQDLKSRVVGDVGPPLALVLAAVASVLLVACVNAVNLLIARALARRRELSIRRALGATRGRLVQHLLVESGVLAAGAALIGLAVAAAAVGAVSAHGGPYIPRVDEVRLSGPVLGWLAALAAGAGLLLFVGALVPALHRSRQDMEGGLRSGGRSATDGPRARRLRQALVSAEFVLATPLLIGAVLLTASLDRLSRVDVGIDTDRILTAEVALSGARYANNDARRAFWDRALDRLSAVPGVDVAALADSRPPNQAGNRNNFDLEDRPTPPGGTQPTCIWVGVSAGFFRAAGLTLERGRALDDRSLRSNEVVVDRVWASRFFPGEEVLGRRFKEGGCSSCPWTTVVGVVDRVKWSGLEAMDDGTVYAPVVDFPTAFLIVRAAGNPAPLAPLVRHAVAELDPALSLSAVATGDELVSASLAAPRDLSVVVGLFGLAALALSVLGVYGVMAYYVEQRARDMGIRLALGGAPSAIRRMVMVQGLGLAGLGATLGTSLAVVAAQWMTSRLFGISATDLRVLVAVPVALVGLAALACLVPARRAARVDPSAILREG